MDQNLQTVLDLINKNTNLSEDERAAIISKLNETDKKISIDEFKLERSESVKKTISSLLEETIAELELKRKVVEDKNRDLLIEAALERVRASAMAMHNSEGLSR